MSTESALRHASLGVFPSCHSTERASFTCPYRPHAESARSGDRRQDDKDHSSYSQSKRSVRRETNQKYSSFFPSSGRLGCIQTPPFVVTPSSSRLGYSLCSGVLGVDNLMPVHYQWEYRIKVLALWLFIITREGGWAIQRAYRTIVYRGLIIGVNIGVNRDYNYRG